MKRRTYGSAQRTLDQKRAAAVQLVTMRRSLDGYTAEEFARVTGLNLPEASAMLERERMHRERVRHG